MCIARVDTREETERLKASLLKKTTMWKVFRRLSFGRLCSMSDLLFGFSIGKNVAPRPRKRQPSLEETGFHCFLSLEEAGQFISSPGCRYYELHEIEVETKDIIATGEVDWYFFEGDRPPDLVTRVALVSAFTISAEEYNDDSCRRIP